MFSWNLFLWFCINLWLIKRAKWAAPETQPCCIYVKKRCSTAETTITHNAATSPASSPTPWRCPLAQGYQHLSLWSPYQNIHMCWATRHIPRSSQTQRDEALLAWMKDVSSWVGEQKLHALSDSNGLACNHFHQCPLTFSVGSCWVTSLTAGNQD